MHGVALKSSHWLFRGNFTRWDPPSQRAIGRWPNISAYSRRRAELLTRLPHLHKTPLSERAPLICIIEPLIQAIGSFPSLPPSRALRFVYWSAQLNLPGWPRPAMGATDALDIKSF